MINQIQDHIRPLQEQLKAHAIYNELNSLDRLKTFMESHAFAVWDFMNLATSLQHHFSCLSIPWHPVKSPKLARLITSIKCEEESDELDGEIISHFEYYVKSMKAVGAKTEALDAFIEALPTSSYSDILNHNAIPSTVKPFLNSTYDCIKTGPESIAASFAFGRETLIPMMFIEILEQSHLESHPIQNFLAYLKRHIELDGDEHGDMALEIVEETCGKDPQKWASAKQAAADAITARIALYDAIRLNF